MSARGAVADPAARRSPRGHREHDGAQGSRDLRAPQGPQHAAGMRRVPFAVLLIGLVVGGLVLLLALNTASAANELRRHDLADKDARIAAQLQGLRNQVADSAAPENLARAARALGMVPATRPAFLVTGPDGTVRVMGSPGAVQGAPVAAPRTTPKPKPTTSAKTSAAATKSASKSPSTTSKSASKSKSTSKSASRSASKSKSTTATRTAPPSPARTPTSTPVPNVTLPGGDDR